jgi:glutaredoxin
VSSSEAVSCYIPPSSEEEAMEQFRSSPSPVSCSWEIRLKELATYKEQNNGSTNVPQRYSSNEPLGNWVTRQRQQYKLFTTTGKGSMTDERIKSLNELDFEWGNRTSLCSWEVRLKELATYKEQNNGSTNVPQQFPSNKPLGQWVTRQRQQYKLFTTTGKGSMTDERIKSLNELDFEWVCVKNTFWEDRLKELTIYKQANGSTNVPQRYSSNEPLGNWVSQQRQQYKLFTTTGKGSMTDERIKSLNELDFEWSINRRIVENITMSTFAVKRELKDRRNPLIKIFNKGQKYFPDTHS